MTADRLQPQAEKSPVDQNLHGLAAKLEELHGTFSRLEGRLSSVLVPPVPEPKAASVDNPILKDRLADRIAEAYQRADSLGSRMAGAISRLEI